MTPKSALILILLLGIFLRAYALDIRPLHVDESTNILRTWEIYKHSSFSFVILDHGPTLYYSIWSFFKLFGDSLMVARLVFVVFGAGMIMLIWGIRDALGKKGFFVSSLLLAVSPVFVYYSRFIRHDIIYEFFFLAMVVSIWLFIKSKKDKYIYLGAFLLGLLFSTKEESVPITLIILAPFLVYYLIKNKPYHLYPKLLLALVITLSTIIVTYTVFFQNLSQIDILISQIFTRAGASGVFLKEFGYYWNIIGWEKIIILMGIGGLITSILKKNKFMMLISWWFVVNLILFNYYSYKMPWLVMHFLSPSILLAGYFIDNLFESKDKKEVITIWISIIILTFFLLISTIDLNYKNFATPLYYDNSKGVKLSEGEGLVEAGQATNELNKALSFLYPIAKKDNMIFSSELPQFKWYFRDYEYASIGDLQQNPPQFYKGKLVITNYPMGSKLADLLNNNGLQFKYNIFPAYSHAEGVVVIFYDIT